MPEKNIQAELDALNLEKARREVANLRSEEAMRRIRRDATEMSLRAEADADARRHAGCWHKKGGNGVENLFRGNDNNYAVVKHILPTGTLIVVCQRCGCLWEPPPKALLKENRKEYVARFNEYQKAVAFPTDNTTSGSQVFLVSEELTAA